MRQRADEVRAFAIVAAILVSSRQRSKAKKGRVLDEMVELMGVEPTTS